MTKALEGGLTYNSATCTPAQDPPSKLALHITCSMGSFLTSQLPQPLLMLDIRYLLLLGLGCLGSDLGNDQV